MRSIGADLINPKESLQEAKWVFPRHVSLQRFLFGAVQASESALLQGAVEVPTGQRLLAGPEHEYICTGEPSLAHCEGALQLFESSEMLTGFIRQPAEPANLEEQAYRLYRDILRAAPEYYFCRFWNFVPEINHVESGMLENYKLFSSGRARAFIEVFGQDGCDQFPAASATGSRDGHLTVVFLGSKTPVRNWENPEQIPAYRYPESYGPRPPSFARASLFMDRHGGEWVFISGTAAIKGHSSQCLGDFAGQLEVTLDNLDLTLQQAGLRLVQDGSRRRRHFKVFLRQAKDLDFLLERVSPLMGGLDTLTVVEADICRQELEVEIEMSVAPPDINADG